MRSPNGTEEAASPDRLIVAIDGPAGSGKSTVARMVADRLGFTYLDTGAMYRAVGVLALAANLSADDETNIGNLARSLKFDFHPNSSGSQSLIVNGEDLTKAIRTRTADEWAAHVAALPAIREAMVNAQREIVCGSPPSKKSPGWVVEGRDMQTVVFPEAQVKIFLTASLEERAKRRLKDIQGRGEQANLQELVAEVAQRDHLDETRTVGPLRRAPDAIEINTDGSTQEEIVERIISLAQGKLASQEDASTPSPRLSPTTPNPRAHYPLYYIGRAFFRAVFRLMGRWRIYGKEDFPPSGGVILAPNHISYADPPLAGSAVERKTWFMAKSQLFEIPILGPILPKVCAFPVKRGKPDRNALRTALELLAAGEVVVVFPEGTRSPDGELQQPELGVALLALRSGAPVVPMGLIGSDRLLPRHSPIPRFARVSVRIGKPLYFDRQQSPSRESLESVAKEVMSSLAALIAEGL